jgi:hypothetical protein
MSSISNSPNEAELPLGTTRLLGICWERNLHHWIPMQIRQGYHLLLPALDGVLPFVIITWWEDKQSDMRAFRKPRQDYIWLQLTIASSNLIIVLEKLKQIIQTIPRL